MRRREVIAGIGVAAAARPVALQAQPAAPRRVGALLGTPRRVEAFRQAMNALGYREGHDVVIDVRSNAEPSRLAGYVSELIAGRAEVIVAQGSQSVIAAREATKTIPIVMAWASDPVGTGLVASLARPGGNVTGISALGTQLTGKRLELLREIMPGLTAAAVLWASDDPPAALALKETEDVARKFGIALDVVGLREAREIDGALAALAGGRAQALIVLSSLITGVNARRIAELAVQHRLPAVGYNRQMAERGFLIAYGADLDDVIRRAAHYVDRILRGTRPEDLPVEQPTKLELVVNLATARALGRTVPPALLARADEVIE